MVLIRRLRLLLSGLVSLSLLIFTLRRWLFTVTALQTDPPPEPPPSNWPPVLLLIPFHNEADSLPALLDHLRRLEYPPAALRVMLIDDASTDDSLALVNNYISVYAKEVAHWSSYRLKQNCGKAEALNHALAKNPFGQFVAVFDADERPHPSALKQLIAACQPPHIGAVSGQRRVSNTLASPTASYITFESLVHQQLTCRAKNRLGLAPPLLGSACLYRRAALTQLKQPGFQPHALLEDSDLTLRLHLSGWQTRFVPPALSEHQAATRWQGYARQHLRWGQGFHAVAQNHSLSLLQQSKLPLALRLELFLFSLGYLDRVALLLGLLLACWPNQKPLRALLGLHLLTPALQLPVALKLSHAPPPLWQRLGWVPVFFGLDSLIAAASTLASLSHHTPRWETRRQRDEPRP